MQVINNPYKIIILQKLRNLVRIISIVLLLVSVVLQNSLASENAQTKPVVVKVAVASNFLLPMKYLKANFEKTHPIQIKISSASTAKLYAQIFNGAPFDVFLAADAVTPQKLVYQGVAQSADIFQYAKGQLVLWSVRREIKSADELRKRLLNGAFSRLALANPKTAPYGRAAMDVLAHYSLNVERRRLILGESVGQTYQFTGSGNVDMGFVALSQLKGGPRVLKQASYWVLPSTTYEPILQYGLLLRQNRHNAGADAFVHYLKSADVQAMLRDKFGYL